MKKLICLFVMVMLVLFSVAYAEEDEYTDIVFGEEAVIPETEGLAFDESVLTITEPGHYRVSGALNGNIVIDCTESEEEDEKVVLCLAGIDITAESSPAIYCICSPKRLSLVCEEGTENSVSDTAIETDDPDAPNGAIYSKSDVTISGAGSLTVNGNYKNGIVSKDDLRIKGDIKLTVNAVKHGISGKDSVEIVDGIITVNAGKDGVRSMGNDESSQGHIAVYGGSLMITCGDDPLKATAKVSVTGGFIDTQINNSEK